MESWNGLGWNDLKSHPVPPHAVGRDTFHWTRALSPIQPGLGHCGRKNKSVMWGLFAKSSGLLLDIPAPIYSWSLRSLPTQTCDSMFKCSVNSSAEENQRLALVPGLSGTAIPDIPCLDEWKNFPPPGAGLPHLMMNRLWTGDISSFTWQSVFFH